MLLLPVNVCLLLEISICLLLSLTADTARGLLRQKNSTTGLADCLHNSPQWPSRPCSCDKLLHGLPTPLLSLLLQ
jgi:hypothetical protein